LAADGWPALRPGLIGLGLGGRHGGCGRHRHHASRQGHLRDGGDHVGGPWSARARPWCCPPPGSGACRRCRPTV